MPNNDAKKTPRMRRREARIESILDASMQILTREGLNGLTIQQLADELDYTPGAFYRYFPSKDAILVELQRRTLNELHDTFKALWRRCEQLSQEQNVSGTEAALLPILATARLYRELPALKPTHFGLIQLAVSEPRQIVQDDEIGPLVSTVMSLLGDVARLIATASTQGALSPSEVSPAQRAVALWSALHGAMLMRKFGRFDEAIFDPKHLGQDVCHSLLIGWGAEPIWVDEARALLGHLEEEGGTLIQSDP
ncbi:MAG: TetR/AcrR family transcriptional regulator [Myxococcota bacterium]